MANNRRRPSPNTPAQVQWSGVWSVGPLRERNRVATVRLEAIGVGGGNAATHKQSCRWGTESLLAGSLEQYCWQPLVKPCGLLRLLWAWLLGSSSDSRATTVAREIPVRSQSECH